MKPASWQGEFKGVFQETWSSEEITEEEQYYQKHQQTSEEAQRSSKTYQNSKWTQ